MSTRSNIIVEDDYRRIQLYRHYDGYPDTEWGVLATLEDAMPYAWPLPRFEATEFAAALVRAWKQENGGGIYIDGSPQEWELVHGDIEWVYVIKPHKETKPNHDSIHFPKGEPIVDIYRWVPEQIKCNRGEPKPILQVELSKAKKVGLEWELKA